MSARGEASGRRVALVTGGGARIGLAICQRLAADGYAVAIHSRRETDESREALDSITKLGGIGTNLVGDLAISSTVRSLVPSVTERLGPVTLLVNNASSFRSDDVTTLDEAVWDDHFAINLRAPSFLMCDMAKHLPSGLHTGEVRAMDGYSDVCPSVGSAYPGQRHRSGTHPSECKTDSRRFRKAIGQRAVR
jgi:NAD(P)-dependent dehydrogenase (short-subunit alcohol dehydrogenase family)